MRGQHVLPGGGPLLPEMPLPPELPPDNDPPTTTYVIEYDDRSDGGPRHVGPFTTRSAAFTHADTKNGPDWTASYCVVPITHPDQD